MSILHGSLKSRRDGYKVTKRAVELPTETTKLTPEQRERMQKSGAGNDPNQTALATGAIIEASLRTQEYNEESLVSFEAAAAVLGSYAVGAERMLDDNRLQWRIKGALSIIFFRFQAGIELILRESISDWNPAKAEEIRKEFEKYELENENIKEEEDNQHLKVETKKGRGFRFLEKFAKKKPERKKSLKSVLRSIPSTIQKADPPQIERSIVISIISTGRDAIKKLYEKPKLDLEEEAVIVAYEKEIFATLGYNPNSMQPLEYKFISLYICLGKKAKEYADFVNERYSEIGIQFKNTPFRIAVLDDDKIAAVGNQRHSARVTEFTDLMKIQANLKEMCLSIVDQLNHWFANLTSKKTPLFNECTESTGNANQEEEKAFESRMAQYIQFNRRYWMALDEHNKDKVDILNPLQLPDFYFSERNVCGLEKWEGRDSDLSEEQRAFFTNKGYHPVLILPQIIEIGSWLALWEVAHARKLRGLRTLKL